MGRIIVTRTKISKTPYVMKESGNLLFSYEELCYYMKTRTVLWVEEKVRTGLTDKMAEWGVLVENLDQKGPVDAARIILNAGNYLKKEETDQLLLVMEEYLNSEDLYVMKEKGDFYLSYGKIKKAYQMYWKSISLMTGEEAAEWKASLYHNMGIVCCRFFYWKEAKNWFALAIDARDTLESRTGLELVLDMEKKGWTSDGSSISDKKFKEEKIKFLHEIA